MALEPKDIKIAIVEDQPEIAHMYRFKFESKGYQVEMAEDGQEGLDLIFKFQPHIILSDIMMPGMDGIEMLRKLRKKNKEVPVVLLTNRGKEETNSMEGDLSGLNILAYIVKADLTPAQVCEKTEEYLRQFGLL